MDILLSRRDSLRGAVVNTVKITVKMQWKKVENIDEERPEAHI